MFHKLNNWPIVQMIITMINHNNPHWVWQRKRRQAAAWEVRVRLCSSGREDRTRLRCADPGVISPPTLTDLPAAPRCIRTLCGLNHSSVTHQQLRMRTQSDASDLHFRQVSHSSLKVLVWKPILCLMRKPEASVQTHTESGQRKDL